jgi:hypothetical protein
MMFKKLFYWGLSVLTLSILFVLTGFSYLIGVVYPNGTKKSLEPQEIVISDTITKKYVMYDTVVQKIVQKISVTTPTVDEVVPPTVLDTTK